MIPNYQSYSTSVTNPKTSPQIHVWQKMTLYLKYESTLRRKIMEEYF